jgi:hypothetical protein
MAKIAEKVKEKVTGAKDKVKDATDKATNTTKKSMSSTTATTATASTSTQDREFEEGGPGRDHEYGRKDDPLTDYRDKEPMTHAKIKEHEPTAVKREMRK